MAPRGSKQNNGDAVMETAIPADLENFNPAEYIKTTHNTRLYLENQNLKKRVKELLEYQLAHPKLANPKTRPEIDNEDKVKLEIEVKKKYIRAQMAVIKTLYRQSVMKVREEKEQTAKSRAHNDGLILGLNNLKYEEQSLRSEISAAENHDHKYKKLHFISAEAFIEEFPQHKDASEHDLMIARIDHEHQVRLKLEERRQEKLKQKQMLIKAVKNGKDALTKLDGMVETFIEAAKPISAALADDKIMTDEEWTHVGLSPDVLEIVSAEQPVRKAVSPALPQLSPAPTVPSLTDVVPVRPKITLKDKMDKEAEVVQKDIATLKLSETTEQDISKILVDRFGPIFSRVVDCYVPDPNVRGDAYMCLAFQFGEDMKKYLIEKAREQ